MAVNPQAGKPATPAMLVNVPRLIAAYYSGRPDPAIAAQRVAFGTSGHRGSSLTDSFNEAHILAITQAICRYRAQQGIDGPLFLAKDTHALSEPAFVSALEVLAANSIEVMVDEQLAYTPTPTLSHAILTYNRRRRRHQADGIVITPSHNPPEDGGFKYNPPHGGPADTKVTARIEKNANAFLESGLKGVRRIPWEKAIAVRTTHRHDYITAYVADLGSVVDMKAIRRAGLKIGVDPLGGAGVHYWPRIAEHYDFRLDVLNTEVDPTFRFMTVDWDGRIRMDCSSPYAMARLIALKNRFDIAFACDTDHDRHGVVARSVGLLNPNHYLAVMISYLFRHRPGWRRDARVGKTLVSSSIIDRVAGGLRRGVLEVPVGFKWFVDGLLDGSLGFGGEESAGASFQRRHGTVWTTDKDGLAPALLSAEITARTGRDPGEWYKQITERYGDPLYERIDSPTTPEQKEALLQLRPAEVSLKTVGGEPIKAILTKAPGNGAPVGGVKVVADSGWFAVRPSGTEDVYKLYAESFKDRAHLRQLQADARALVKAITPKK